MMLVASYVRMVTILTAIMLAVVGGGGGGGWGVPEACLCWDLGPQNNRSRVNRWSFHV